MFNIFGNIQFSPISFLIGLLLGILILWLLLVLQKYLPNVIKTSRLRINNLRENLTTSTDVRLLNEIYRYTQKQHLANSMFSLDEIVIEPKVLTPLIQSYTLPESAPTDCVSLAVPYIPDWPELAAIFNASKMTLIEALQGNANIILAGHPGYGKSVALAWLAAKIARNDKSLGKLSGLLPVYIHATDIPNIFDRNKNIIKNIQNSEVVIDESVNQTEVLSKKKPDEIVNLLIQALSRYLSPLSIGRLPKIINSALDNSRAILILDRVDELAPDQSRLIAEYIRILNKKYPNLRTIIALSYDDLAGMPELGFCLLGMAAWSEEDQKIFLQKWSKQWAKYITPVHKEHNKNINSYYLKSWLSTNNKLHNPLEFTLNVWSAFAGDIIGMDGPSAIESYIRRMIPDELDSRSDLEQFALQQLIEMSCVSNPIENERLLGDLFTTDELSDNNENTTLNEEKSASNNRSPKVLNSSRFELLLNTGFLIKFPETGYSFSHPSFCGYFAGKALSEFGGQSNLLKQPSWMAKNLAMYYFARYGDVTSIIQHYIQEDDVLHTNHLLVSRWLQIAPKNRAWRTIILRTLTSILQKERESISLAAKILSSLAFSGDAGVSMYFRQLLKSDHPNIKQLAALGCGILAEKNAIDDLNQILQEQSPASIRCASLALSAIGDKRALEILAANMLNGSELVRRYAAEALANNPSEGHQALNEGSSMEDLLVRRSVVFGLMRIDQPWAKKIVENLQLEDNEWVVRNAAIQAFDELEKKKNYAPLHMAELMETQWLIDYANREGVRLAPGKPAEDLVKKALINGNQDEKLLALDFFRYKCDRNSIQLIYSTFKNSKSELRDASYYILWLMTLAGVRLPFSFE